MDTKKLVIVIFGLVAAVGQWFPQYYLPLIGGVVAAITALTLKS